MKQALLTSCAVFSLVSAPAFAEENPSFDQKTFYAAVFGGVNLLESSDVSIDAVTTNSLNEVPGEINFENGFVIGGAIGVVFAENWRGEAELSYRRNEVSSYYEGTIGGTALRPDNLANSDDYVSAFAVMANIWRDFDVNDTFAVHLGGGVGAAWVSADLLDIDTSNANNNGLDDSTWVLAGQAGAGIDWKMLNGWIASLDYRAFITDAPNFDGTHSVDGGSFKLEHDYFSHSIMVGLRMPLQGH
ncbi:MAG: outer membrane beta-barrel protein [Hyphomicrobiales bacterium]